MYVASMYVKTALDVAKPKYIAQILEEQNMHGWPIAALLREMGGHKGEAIFEKCGEQVPVHKGHQAGKCGGSKTAAEKSPNKCSGTVSEIGKARRLG